MNEDDLKNKLSEEEYRVTQEKGTKAPFSGKYWNNNEDGEYKCKVCGQTLFSSNVKLDSSSGPMGLQGWPAFEDAIPGSIDYREDTSHGMNRTEVVCSRCGSHLGHMFDDNETKTGKHFCINSCSLDFDKNN